MEYFNKIDVKEDEEASFLQLPINLPETCLKNRLDQMKDLTGDTLRGINDVHNQTCYKACFKTMWIKEPGKGDFTTTFNVALSEESKSEWSSKIIKNFKINLKKQTDVWAMAACRLSFMLDDVNKARVKPGTLDSLMWSYPTLKILVKPPGKKSQEIILKRKNVLGENALTYFLQLQEENPGVKILKLSLFLPPLTALVIEKGASFWTALGLPYELITADHRAIPIPIEKTLKQGYDYYAAMINNTFEPVEHIVKYQWRLDDLYATTIEKMYNNYSNALQSIISENDLNNELIDDRAYKITIEKIIPLPYPISNNLPEVSITWPLFEDLKDFKAKFSHALKEVLRDKFNLGPEHFTITWNNIANSITIKSILLLEDWVSNSRLKISILNLDVKTAKVLPKLNTLVIPISYDGNELTSSTTEGQLREIDTITENEKTIIIQEEIGVPEIQNLEINGPCTILIHNKRTSSMINLPFISNLHMAGIVVTKNKRVIQAKDIYFRNLPTVLTITLQPVRQERPLVFKYDSELYYWLSIELIPRDISDI